MAKWSLKNRDSDNKPPEMPPAAENYYRAEKRDRMVGVWLLGLATLAVTAVLAFLLFLGGRWVYRQFTDNNETAAPTETSQNENGGETAAPAGEGGETDNSDTTDTQDEGQDQESTNGQEVAGTTEDTDGNGVVSDEAASTDLPNTGPADTLALFVGVTLVATLVHRTVAARE